MRQCAEAGYPVRAVIMPIIPIGQWQEAYATLIEEVLGSARAHLELLEELTAASAAA